MNTTCSSSSFRYLLATQFLVALNDNIYKLVVGLLMIHTLVADTDSVAYLCASQAFFVLPFILFSSYAGYFADRYSKTQIIRTSKILELLIMSFGAYFLIQGNATMLVILVFFLGLQSTLFSPSKYGIMPELLSSEHLSKGNGYLELFTFLAIILGSVLGGFLVAIAKQAPSVPAVCIVVVAIIGLATSYGITKTEEGSADISFSINPFRDALHGIRGIAENRSLFMIMLAICYFWAMGAFFQVHLLLYAKDVLGVSEAQTGILLAAFAVGIGIGSVTAGTISEGKVEIGLVPIGGLGISLFASLLSVTHFSFYLTCGVMLCLGVSSGFFIVPLNAYFQKYSPEDSRGRFLAALNVCTFTAMLFSYGALFAFVEYLQLSMIQISLVLGAFALLVGIYVVYQLPEMLIRCLNWIFIHLIYRLKVIGAENIPARGGALLVCNHISFVDASLILAAIDRPVRFLMWRPFYELPLIHPIAKAMGAVPVASGESKEQIMEALSAATKAIESGEVVCIFAEGGITRTGQLLKFKRGLEAIMEGQKAPIIPLYLDQLWGSVFSYHGGKFFWKRPKRLPYPTTLAVGEPLPANSTAAQVRLAVSELGARAFSERDFGDELLTSSFIQSVSRNPNKIAIRDSNGRCVSYQELLEEALTFVSMWRKEHTEQHQVVIVDIAPSVEAAVSTIGLLLSGNIPCHTYGYTQEQKEHAVKATAAKNLIVAQEKDSQNYRGLVSHSYASLLERAEASVREAAKSLSKTGLKRLLEEDRARNSPHDPALILFTRGRTAEPLPVALSHHNILSNCVALYDAYTLAPEDSTTGVIPFSSPGGLTCTLWLPLLSGMTTALYSTPGDWTTLDDFLRKNPVQFFPIGASMFEEVSETVSKDSLKHLRSVLVGGDRVTKEASQGFRDKFGVEALIGYGCAELSPVALVHVDEPDEENTVIHDIEKQNPDKRSALGHPLPGVAVKVVDDFDRTLPNGEVGRLWVKGPNVMIGYYGMPEKTKERVKDNWFDTGDRAKVNDEGFVFLIPTTS